MDLFAFFDDCFTYLTSCSRCACQISHLLNLVLSQQQWSFDIHPPTRNHVFLKLQLIGFYFHAFRSWLKSSYVIYLAVHLGIAEDNLRFWDNLDNKDSEKPWGVGKHRTMMIRTHDKSISSQRLYLAIPLAPTSSRSLSWSFSNQPAQHVSLIFHMCWYMCYNSSCEHTFSLRSNCRSRLTKLRALR